MNINRGLPKWRLEMMLQNYYEFLHQVYTELSSREGKDYIYIFHESIKYLEHQVNNFPELYQTTEIADYKTKLQNLVKPGKVYVRPTYKLDSSLYKGDFYWPSPLPFSYNSDKPRTITVTNLIRSKSCGRCGLIKNFYEFNKSALSKDGLTDKCSECLSHNKKHPKRRKHELEAIKTV